jgi:hypothetical protein
MSLNANKLLYAFIQLLVETRDNYRTGSAFEIHRKGKGGATYKYTSTG